jgi:hypothetical protein
MDGLKEDLKKDTNRILWGDGVGVLATIDTDQTGLTVSVGTDAASVRYIDLDMMVDICEAGGTVIASNRQVLTIDEDNGNFTISGANVDMDVTDVVVRTGNYGLEPNGLTNIVSASTTLHGLAPGTEPLWKSREDTAVGNLSETRMISMCDALRVKGGRPSVIMSDLGSRRAYFNLLTTQRRFTGTKDFGGGFTGMTFSYDEDIPMVTDVDAPSGKMWFLDEDKFKIYRRKPWYFEDTDGSIWKWVTGYDAFEAMMKQYWEFAIKRRNTSGVMTGINAG